MDEYVLGSEHQAFRLESGCAEGSNIELWIGEGSNIELWIGEGSSHTTGYGDAFVDALVDWLLAQE